jgi:formate hydrogenlyase transcriptional activator
VAGTDLSSSALSGDRVDFETLLSNISAKLVAADSDRLEDTVTSALEGVKDFFRADRCALCAVTNDLQTVRFSYIVYSDGVSNLFGDLNLALLFPWVRQQVVIERRTVALAGLAELPPEAAVDRATFEARGTRSILCIPIEVAPARLDLILVSNVREEGAWPEEYVPRLRLLGEILVNALERAQTADRAREQAARLAAAADAAELGFGEWMQETRRPYLDARLCDLLGIAAEEADHAHVLWGARVEAETRRTVAENHRRLFAGDIERATAEYRYEHPLRGPTWLRHSARRMDGVRGQGTRIIQAVEDVTGRRQALEEVQRLRDRLERENVYLQQEVKRRLGPDRIVGRSAAIRRTLALAEQVASTDSTVLLMGETGSGKERFAAFIHECSRRRARPMVTVNCSAIPTALMESELFGREKGAYTGAFAKQVGRFELAHGSTLFLDEIGDLPGEVQVKLLRVIETRTIERLGNPRPVAVDVRIVAATHRDLAAAVRAGRFREDLYYRLNVFPIVVPPLRDRPEDIHLFVQAFIDELAASMGKRIQEVDPASLTNLVTYAWPGNVRELRNVVERAMIMAEGPVLQVEIPTADAAEAVPTSPPAVGRSEVLKVLRDCGWRIRGPYGAAARLGLKPTTLESRIKKLGLARP